jgi:anionic cell wall polymer biosynthesis LytR-Cps2A-Psr (LCP) family protein
MVETPGFGRRKINSVYLIGETRLGKGYGAALLKQTVSDLVGVPIHHFALINFDGFRKVIDLVGGISIDVRKQSTTRVIRSMRSPAMCVPCRCTSIRDHNGWTGNAR